MEIILVRATSSQQLIDRSKKQLKERKNWPYLQGGKSTSRKKIRHSCPIMSLQLLQGGELNIEEASFIDISTRHLEQNINYSKVATRRPGYYSILDIFVQSLQA